MQPSISIIIPTYNRAKYLKKALDSLVMQTDNNFEVVVVNDGGCDKTKEVCDKFKDKLDLKYIYQNHAGISATRNKGIELALGTVIVFFDDDAIAEDNWVENIKKNIENNFIITGQVKPIRNNIWQYFATHYNQGDKIIISDIIIEGNCAIKRQVFENVGNFDEKLTYGHDGIEFISRTRQKYQIIYCPDMIIYHDYSSGLFNYLLKQLRFGHKMAYLNIHKIKGLLFLVFNYKKLRSMGMKSKNKENKLSFLKKLRIYPIFKLGTICYLLGSLIGYLKYKKMLR